MSDDTKPAVIIHIGGPKTGSTYLQKRLRLNRDILGANGIHLPYCHGLEKVAGNAKVLASLMSTTPSPKFARSSATDASESLTAESALAELLQRWNSATDTLLLSAETFQPAHAEKLRALLPVDCQPRIVLFVRNQLDWMASYFNQLTKTQDVVQTPNEFVDEVLSRRREHLYCPDWDYQYRTWKTVFGHCEVCQYEWAKSDLMAAFFAAANIATQQPLPDIERTQTSLHPFQIRLLYDVNTGKGRWSHHQYLACFRHPDTESPDPGRYTLLSPASVDTIQRKFMASNRALASRLKKSPEFHRVLTLPSAALLSREYLDFSEIPSLPEYQQYVTYCDDHIHANLSRDSSISQAAA